MICYIDIKILKNLYNNFTLNEVKKILKENISQNKLNFELNKNLSLPNYVIKESDIYSIFDKDQNLLLLPIKK